jgi:hypothetical protein
MHLLLCCMLTRGHAPVSAFVTLRIDPRALDDAEGQDKPWEMSRQQLLGYSHSLNCNMML